MKDFLIIGNGNAVTYKDIFPLIKENRLWMGITLFTGKMPFFKVPDDYPIDNCRFEKREDGLYKQVNIIAWFTNLEHNRRHQPLDLYKRYTPEEYPKYDNYDAINVDKTKDIPIDYDGVMGVPITFLDKYCPEQFEIVCIASGHSNKSMSDIIKDEVGYNNSVKSNHNRSGYGIINGKQQYARILIRKK